MMGFGFSSEVATRKLSSKLKEAPVFGKEEKKKKKKRATGTFTIKGISAPKEKFVNIDRFRR